MKLVARQPEIGHTRDDLTARPVRFWPIYSYLVFDPASKPALILRVLHGNRDIDQILQ